jgi:hypothetical protein
MNTLKTLAIAAALAATVIPAKAADTDKSVECMLSNAVISLHRQARSHSNADAITAAENAQTAAARACKPRGWSEGAGDYVWHAIEGMAKVWFDAKAQ